jgi:RNA polymerase sigma-70 factor (ECF subfamily)
MHSDDFAQLVARHYESLYRFAFSLARVEADACDLTQQTFCLWAAKDHQRQDQSKAKAWLFTTLHRVFTRQRRAGFPHGLEEKPLEDLLTISSDAAHAVDASQVLSALAKVDRTYQAAVALFYLEDFSYQEIESVLDLPLGTVKSRIAHGLVQLRQLLGVAAPNRPAEAVPSPVHRADLVCDGSADHLGPPNGYSAGRCD